MSLKRNVVANFGGSAWSALMGLAFVPFYIRLMGVESYGIVGVFTSLMGMLAILDLGLAQALNREMARLSSEVQKSHRMADTARTLEVVYWGVALVVGVIIALLAGPIANYWLNPEQLTRGNLQQALWIMGLVIALRWPVSLYIGGLNGLQRQVPVNVAERCRNNARCGSAGCVMVCSAYHTSFFYLAGCHGFGSGDCLTSCILEQFRILCFFWVKNYRAIHNLN